VIESSRRALQAIDPRRASVEALARRAAPALLPQAAAPTLKLLREPAASVEHLMDILDEQDPRRKKALRRQQAARRGMDLAMVDGHPTLGGRRCCAVLAARLDRQLARLRLPAQFTCECGAVYELAMAPREERRHG